MADAWEPFERAVYVDRDPVIVVKVDRTGPARIQLVHAGVDGFLELNFYELDRLRGIIGRAQDAMTERHKVPT